MEAKWANSSKSELFIDTKSIPIIKKQVLSIKEQEEYESRNLWKVVTASLKRQDVNEATAAKYKIEQHQRDLVKEREDNSLKWEHRVSLQIIKHFNSHINMFYSISGLSFCR